MNDTMTQNILQVASGKWKSSTDYKIFLNKVTVPNDIFRDEFLKYPSESMSYLEHSHQ